MSNNMVLDLDPHASSCEQPGRQSSLYSALIRDTSIRVLTLHPGSGDNTIITTLAEVNTEEQDAKYEALSYTWGSEPRNQEIICNDSTICIPPNCFDALKQLRHSLQPCHLWVDSICIDQFSLTECNHQVGMMSRIYKKASRVIAWLGPGDAISRRAFLFLHNASHRIKATAEAARYAEMPDTIEGIWRILGAAYNSDISPESKAYIVASRKESVRCVKKLLQRSWFQRIWTVQELAVSETCLVVCGEDRILWDNMIVVLRALDLLPDHCFILLPALGHLLGQKVVEHDWSAEDQRELPLALTLLVSCRSKDSTDPRDKVYGLYGLLGRDKALNVDVDYSKSVEEVYMDIAITILSESRSPTLLLFATSFPPATTTTSSKLELPSWVPDWTLRDFDVFLKDHSYDCYLIPQSAWAIFDIDNPSFSASGDSCMATKDACPNTRQLVLHGHNHFDEVVSVQYCSFPAHELNLKLDSNQFPRTSADALAYVNCRWDLVIPILRHCLSTATVVNEHPFLSMIKDLLYHHLSDPLDDTDLLHLFITWRSLIEGPRQLSHTTEKYSALRRHGPISLELALDLHYLSALHTESKWASTFAILLGEEFKIGLSILNDPAAKQFHEMLILLLDNHYIYFTKE